MQDFYNADTFINNLRLPENRIFGLICRVCYFDNNFKMLGPQYIFNLLDRPEVRTNNISVYKDWLEYQSAESLAKDGYDNHEFLALQFYVFEIDYTPGLAPKVKPVFHVASLATKKRFIIWWSI